MYKVVALDLEGTLISNAVSQFPRPRLYQFLEFCHTYFERVILFTSVPENRVRAITKYLVESGNIPAWFETIEYVNWHGRYKDLNFVLNVTPEQVLLIDD
jgi:NLI interacting factor-like phosphatase